MSDSHYTFKVVTPNGTAFEVEGVSFAKLPGQAGEIGIMPSHSASLIKLKDGEVLFRTDDSENLSFIKEGIAHINPNEVLILAPFIDKKDDIDVERAQSSVERARKRLEGRDPDIDKERARLSLNRAEKRLEIAG